MHQRLVDFLVCPLDKAFPLILEPTSLESDQTVTEGHLHCPQCGCAYPISHGIPRMLPDGLSSENGHASEFLEKRTEMQTRDEQVDIYLKNVGLKLLGKIEIPRAFETLQLSSEDLLLEAGCGIGRITCLTAPLVQEMMGVDFSFRSLVRCQERLPIEARAKTHLVQADISHLPFRSGLFTKGISCQVLEHVPTHDSRSQAIAEIDRVLRPGARFVLSAYQYSLPFRLFGKKEGHHPGGIYFYRFDRHEFREILSRHFHLEALAGILAYLHFATCVKT